MHDKRERQGRRLLSLTAQRRAQEEATRATTAPPEGSPLWTDDALEPEPQEAGPQDAVAVNGAPQPSAESPATDSAAATLDQGEIQLRLQTLQESQEEMSQALQQVSRELARPLTFLIGPV